MSATDSNVSPRQGSVPPRSTTSQTIWGVLLILAGLLGILMPAFAALATVLILAWMLVFAGVFEIAFALQRRHQIGFGWKLVAGLITLALGIALVYGPVAGIAALGLVVGAFLLVGGVTRVMLAMRLRPHRSWGWVLFDGILSIVLAVLIAIGWPSSSVAIIGLLTGFTLLSAGVWRIFLARSAPVA